MFFELVVLILELKSFHRISAEGDGASLKIRRITPAENGCVGRFRNKRQGEGRRGC